MQPDHGKIISEHNAINIHGHGLANELLYEEYFHLTNIEKDFLPVFKRFYSSEKLRTCPKTGEVMEADKRYVSE